MALVGECIKTEPSSFQEVVQQPVWVDAIVEEYDSIVWKSVWDVVPRLENKSVVSSRWLYKVKQAADGSVEKHKARFDSRGFSQVEGIDYDETFAPVVRYSSIRSMLTLSAQMGWKIHQMDMKTSFLNGKIEEEQAPCAWYTRIDSHFTGLGFTKSEADENLYHIIVEGKPLIIVLYVDDLILTGDDQLIKSFKEDLAGKFEMKEMGLMHYFLGMEVSHKDGEVFVSQGKYANDILWRFHMDKCKPMQNPLIGNWRKEDATSGELVVAIVYWKIVGSLMYLVNTQPDLCFAVNQLSQAMVQPTKLFWKAVKHVLRYLRGTSQYGLWYRRTKGVKLQGFTDVDWAGSPSYWKSTSGRIFNLGSVAVS
eukprot:PITA_33051